MRKVQKKYLYILGISSFIFFISIYYTIGIGIWNGIDNFVFRCSDYGKYYTQVINYLQEKSLLKNIVEFANEPGWYLIATNLIRIININISSAIIFFLITIFGLTSLTVIVFIKRITKNPVLAYVGGLLLLISFIQNYTFFIHGRQTLANFLLLWLIFIISFFNLTRKSMIIVASIFLGFIMISHRSIMGVSIIGLGIFFIYSCFFERKYIKPLIAIFAGGIIANLPMIELSLEDYKRTFLYLIEGSTANRSQTGIYNSGGGANQQFGISVITGSYTDSLPLLDYIKYFPAIIILSICSIRKVWINKKIRLLTIFILFLAYYTSGQRFFVNRMATTLDPLVIIIGIVGIHGLKFRNAYIHIALSIILIILHKPGAIFRNTGFIIPKNELSISIFTEVIPKENSIIFGSQCILDLFQQLGYTTAMNYPVYPIAHIKELESSGIFMAPNQLWNFSEIYWNFLGKNEDLILPKFLEHKNVYLLMSNKLFNKKEIKQLENLKENKNFIILNESDHLKNRGYLLDYALKLTGKRIYFQNRLYYLELLKKEKIFN